MSTILSAPASAQVAAAEFAAGRLLGAVKRWWIACLTWRLEQAAIMSLNTMSDRELKDIGLARSEIARAVRGEATHDGAYGRYW